MSAPASTAAVIAALCGNAFVMTIKLAAFLVSGSGAMLSEAIHSAADTGNQLLLYLGLKRGSREADDRFHYGYGGERFVFGILSAAGIFFIGCGVTIYHGILSLLHPHAPEIGRSTFLVLAASFVIEGGVLLFALRGILKSKGDVPFWRYLREGADPAALAILLEDGAAVLGLVVAAAGIGAAYLTGNPLWDAIGSIVVGLVLGLVAIELVLTNRELLLGKAVPEGVEDRFIGTLRGHPAVRDVRDVKTRQLTPETYLFKAEIFLDEAFIAGRLIEQIEEQGGQTSPEIERAVALVAGEAISLVATQIRSLEHAVRAEIPQARHIDLEVVEPAASRSISRE
jgi:zinc transporter 9